MVAIVWVRPVRVIPGGRGAQMLSVTKTTHGLDSLTIGFRRAARPFEVAGRPSLQHVEIPKP